LVLVTGIKSQLNAEQPRYNALSPSVLLPASMHLSTRQCAQLCSVFCDGSLCVQDYFLSKMTDSPDALKLD